MSRSHWLISLFLGGALMGATVLGASNLAAQNAPAAARRPRAVADSLPEGLNALSVAERAVFRAPACTAEVRRLATAQPPATRGGGVIGGAQRLLELLSSASPQTDCLRLATRDTRVFLARSIETEATAMIAMIARSMVSAAEDSTPSRLCPSAPPVPPDLEALRTHAVAVERSASPTDPWRCIQMEFPDPVRYQYEVRTAPDGQSAEIIARGFPVAGNRRSDEIFARVRVGDQSRPALFRR